MQTTLDCYPCLLRQALQTGQFAGAGERCQKAICDLTLEQLRQSPPGRSPLELASSIYQMVRRETGNADPYRQAKKTSNQEGLRLLPIMRSLLRKEEDRLGFALKVAVAGNIMDYGAMARFDIATLLEDLHQHRFAVDDRLNLEARLGEANSLTYFADNAGEIALDRLLIEEFMEEFPIREVRLVVRQEPFLNDACEADAQMVGLNQIPGVKLLSLPVSPADLNPADWSRATVSDVIIAKGMANFENYSDREDFHFLFIAKCDVISRLLTERCGHPVRKGDWILLQGPAAGTNSPPDSRRQASTVQP